MNGSTAAQSSPALVCRVTQLTPAGRSAVATLAVEGPHAGLLVARCVRSRAFPDLTTIPIGRICVGHWHNESGASEEIVVCRRSPQTFELNCHGGLAASESIIRSLVDLGAIRATSEEWLVHHLEDPVRRAAWQALGAARTARAAAILLDQYRGALTASFQAIRAELQSPERDARAAALQRRVDRLLDWYPVGSHLTHPWRIVFAGPPNVGKSSLVNAILGYQRSLVFDQPGTTRDVLVASTALNGWPCELRDTAGLREAEQVIEQEGVARARSSMAEADLVVWVEAFSTARDGRAADPPADMQVLRVANKADLERHGQLPGHWLRTSAVTGEGLGPLIQEMVATLVPLSPAPGEPVPFSEEQFVWLRRLQDAIRQQCWRDAVAYCERLIF